VSLYTVIFSSIHSSHVQYVKVLNHHHIQIVHEEYLVLSIISSYRKCLLPSSIGS